MLLVTCQGTRGLLNNIKYLDIYLHMYMMSVLLYEGFNRKVANVGSGVLQQGGDGGQQGGRHAGGGGIWLT